MSSAQIGEEIVTDLHAVIEQQRRIIEALLAAGEPTGPNEPDRTARLVWQQNVALHRLVYERTERVRSTEHVLRSVINSLDGHMCIVARDGTILGTNKRWDEALAAAGPHVVGGRLGGDFFRFCSPGAPILGAIADDVAGLVRAVIESESGTADRSVKRRVVQDGEHRWMIARVHPVHDSDDAAAVVTAIDITEGMRTQEELHETIRRAESLADALSHEQELLSSVLATIPHLVYWKDQDLRYLGCNQAYLRCRGVPGESALLRRREEEIEVSDALTPVLTDLEHRVSSSGEAVRDVKVHVPGPHGGTRTLLFSVLPQRPSGGGAREGLEGVIGVAADVTHVTDLERQLAQATRLEAIGQLAAGIAHEINTPVQYVSDNTRFLADSFTGLLDATLALADLVGEAEAAGAADADLAGRMAALVRAVDLTFLSAEIPNALNQSMEGLERVARIVRAMKDFSHPGQGWSETDLNRAVESTVHVSRSEWKYVAELELDLDPSLGMVRCYEGELKQAVLNVIVNAAQAIGEDRVRRGRGGLGRIRVATRRGRDVVQIIVSDDGPGMDAATKARVFDPFFTTKEVGRGTGQGLSIAHTSIVSKHGGSIDVDSAPGAGATFTISIPETSSSVPDSSSPVPDSSSPGPGQWPARPAPPRSR